MTGAACSAVQLSTYALK